MPPKKPKTEETDKTSSSKRVTRSQSRGNNAGAAPPPDPDPADADPAPSADVNPAPSAIPAPVDVNPAPSAILAPANVDPAPPIPAPANVDVDPTLSPNTSQANRRVTRSMSSGSSKPTSTSTSESAGAKRKRGPVLDPIDEEGKRLIVIERSKRGKEFDRVAKEIRKRLMEERDDINVRITKNNTSFVIREENGEEFMRLDGVKSSDVAGIDVEGVVRSIVEKP